MFSKLVALDVFFASLALFLMQRWWASKQSKSLLPPGPAPLPVLGNLLDMPTSYQWKTFAEWGKAWGEFQLCSEEDSSQLLCPPR